MAQRCCSWIASWAPGRRKAINTVRLEGGLVTLEPLSLDHVDRLCEVGMAPELWQKTQTNVASRADMVTYVQSALDVQAAGTALPFATILKSDQRVIGSTRFANYEAPHKRIEIGWTWLGPQYQRTGANVEAKLLMLAHAFDELDLNRVEFKTDALNHKSRTALARIGAREEGTLRRHMVLWHGRIRDTVYFSVIREEWPAVRALLQRRLAQ